MTSSDLAADCTLLDGSETVSVTLQRADGATTITIAAALRRRLSREARGFDGVTLVGDETVWHVPDVSLGANRTLHPGDTITVADEVWTIVAVERETFATRWRCACRRQSG